MPPGCLRLGGPSLPVPLCPFVRHSQQMPPRRLQEKMKRLCWRDGEDRNQPDDLGS